MTVANIARPQLLMSCDQFGCRKHYGPSPSTIRDIRVSASMYGWTTRANVYENDLSDYCPEHGEVNV